MPTSALQESGEITPNALPQVTGGEGEGGDRDNMSTRSATRQGFTISRGIDIVGMTFCTSFALNAAAVPAQLPPLNAGGVQPGGILLCSEATAEAGATASPCRYLFSATFDDSTRLRATRSDGSSHDGGLQAGAAGT